VNDVPLQKLVSGSLVRYRCMIQDLFDPEFFLSIYEIHDVDDLAKRRVCCSLYRDVINCEVKISCSFVFLAMSRLHVFLDYSLLTFIIIIVAHSYSGGPKRQPVIPTFFGSSPGLPDACQ